MALQNWYKAVINYSNPGHIVQGRTVVGSARNMEEVVRLIQEKFAPDPNDRVTINSVEYLGWETF